MKWFVLLFSLASVIASGLLVWSAIGFFESEFPDVSRLRTEYPVVAFDEDEGASIRLQHLKPPSWVSLDEISNVAVGAIVVSEDWAFFQHKGYDANQIREAMKEDWVRGRFARGASTITQQVVRNVFLDQDKNLWRKLKELYLAVRLEDAVKKHRILEVYFNIAEWGPGIYGIGSAARHYFGKAPSQLTAKEGAFLAMLLPSPARYSQSFRSRRLTDYARGTINSILSKMTKARYLTEEQEAREEATPLPFEAAPAGTF